MRKSGSEFRRAIITTISDGGIPGLIVESQEPKLDQTRAGAVAAMHWARQDRLAKKSR